MLTDKQPKFKAGDTVTINYEKLAVMVTLPRKIYVKKIGEEFFYSFITKEVIADNINEKNIIKITLR